MLMNEYNEDKTMDLFKKNFSRKAVRLICSGRPL